MCRRAIRERKRKPTNLHEDVLQRIYRVFGDRHHPMISGDKQVEFHNIDPKAKIELNERTIA